MRGNSPGRRALASLQCTEEGVNTCKQSCEVRCVSCVDMSALVDWGRRSAGRWRDGGLGIRYVRETAIWGKAG